MSKFVDSDVIVFAFTNNSRKDKCREFIEEENITINTLILLESHSKVATITKNQELATDMVKLFYKADNIEIINIVPINPAAEKHMKLSIGSP